MKYADVREVLLKGIDKPADIDPGKPETLATPRWLSPAPGKSGYAIAQIRAVQAPAPVGNRSDRREGKRGRNRLPGVSLAVKPWAK